MVMAVTRVWRSRLGSDSRMNASNVPLANPERALTVRRKARIIFMESSTAFQRIPCSPSECADAYIYNHGEAT